MIRSSVPMSLRMEVFLNVFLDKVEKITLILLGGMSYRLINLTLRLFLEIGNTETKT